MFILVKYLFVKFVVEYLDIDYKGNLAIGNHYID